MNRDVHCQYCEVPLEYWKDPLLSTYPDGNGCKFYSEYYVMREEIFEHINFTIEQLMGAVREALLQRFPDVPDITATIQECFDSDLDCGPVIEVSSGIYRNA